VSAPPAPALVATRRVPSRRLVVLGGIVLVAAVIGVVALLLLARARVDEAARDLARAPAGCVTSLDVTRAETYLLFVETTGERREVPGACGDALSYDLPEAPRVRLELRDDDGDELDLDRVPGDVGYDAAGFAGTAVRQVDLSEGAYELAVLAPDADGPVVVSVGTDPADAGAGARRGALAVAALGALVGGVLLLAGAVGRRVEVSQPAARPDPWAPGPPPVAPPIARPPAPGGVHRPPSSYAPPPAPPGERSPWAPVRSASPARPGQPLPPPPAPPDPGRAPRR
jgi:hypothetical protein